MWYCHALLHVATSRIFFVRIVMPEIQSALPEIARFNMFLIIFALSPAYDLARHFSNFPFLHFSLFFQLNFSLCFSLYFSIFCCLLTYKLFSSPCCLTRNANASGTPRRVDPFLPSPSILEINTFCQRSKRFGRVRKICQFSDAHHGELLVKQKQSLPGRWGERR